MVWRSKSACGSKEFNSPFPVSPSGGRPGRAGSPHAGSTLLASKKRWQASLLPAPPTRGLPPPCGSPASAVVLQIVVSIKPELSIWLKTGTFYLALTFGSNQCRAPVTFRRKQSFVCHRHRRWGALLQSGDPRYSGAERRNQAIRLQLEYVG